MEYVNFYVALPLSAYLRLENYASKTNLSRNEIIVHIILSGLDSDSLHLSREKNAGF